VSVAEAGLDDRVAGLMAQLSLEEKVRLLAGASSFALHAIDRLGIPALNMTDGPTGVRSIKGLAATVFPVGVALAATWNPDTAQAVAAAIGREALALGDQVVLAPTINIMRIPTWGRNFRSTTSEKPRLSSEPTNYSANDGQIPPPGPLFHLQPRQPDANLARI